MKRKLLLFLAFFLVVLVSAQTSKIVHLTEAGTLSTQINATEKLVITNLIVSGNIDARDVKFMRDDMTLLATVDISAAYIQAYSGTEGTYPWGTYNYPNSELPKFSFSNGSTGLSKSSLQSVVLPTTLVSIGDDAFYNCDGLTTMNVPNSVSKIGYASFQMCDGLVNVTLGSGLSALGDQAFYDCKKLKIININATIPPTYGGYAFQYTNLSIVFVPSASLSLYKSTDKWKDLPIATNEVITVHNATAGGIVGALNGIGISTLSTISKLVVTGNVNSADFVQFKSAMPLLLELDLSGAVLAANTVPSTALQNKAVLSKVVLPSSVTTIGDYAFSNCTNLKEILPLSSSLTTIGAYAFWKCPAIVGELILPSTLRTIGNSAFNSCSGLNGSLVIPNSVTSIGDYAFQGCSGLNGTLTLSASVTQILGGIFAGCTNINGVLTIPSSVTSIAASAFYDCKKISELEIGQNCSTIGDEAFQNAAALSKITVSKVIPPTITSSTFGGVSKTTCKVYVPAESVNAYKTAAYWSAFVSINSPSTVESFGITLQFGVGGSISVNNANYSNGSVIDAVKNTVLTFNITPNLGYEVASIVYKGVDVLNQYINGQFTTSAITENAVLNVTFKKSVYTITIKDADAGAVNLLCNYGETPMFSFTATEGWKVNSIVYNGEDVTELLVDGVLTLPSVTGNSLLSVSFVVFTGSPQMIADNVKVYANRNAGIVVEGLAQGEVVSIYTVNGQKVYTTISKSDRNVIQLPNNTVYIVKTNYNTYKVML